MSLPLEPALQGSRVRVWDGYVRLGHWLLVGLVGFSWWSAEYGYMEYHRYSGYTVLGLLIFRIYWGFAGAGTARFAHFIKDPRAIWAYLRSKTPHSGPGHNPLGALSVLMLLGLLLAQVMLGLFTVDIDGLESGPLSHWVSFETGRVCAEWHERVFNVLLVFIGLHVAAVLFYLVVRRENLLLPMITGWKTGISTPAAFLERASFWRAMLGVALAAGSVFAMLKLTGGP